MEQVFINPNRFGATRPLVFYVPLMIACSKGLTLTLPVSSNCLLIVWRAALKLFSI